MWTSIKPVDKEILCINEFQQFVYLHENGIRYIPALDRNMMFTLKVT